MVFYAWYEQNVFSLPSMQDFILTAYLRFNLYFCCALKYKIDFFWVSLSLFINSCLEYCNHRTCPIPPVVVNFTVHTEQTKSSVFFKELPRFPHLLQYVFEYFSKVGLICR